MSNKANSIYYSKAITANALVDNGGTILGGGNIATGSPITNVPFITIVGAGAKDNPGPQESANTGLGKALSSGVFGSMTAGEYIVKGGNTDSLASVAYTGLQGGGNPISQRSINSRLTRSTVLITSWNYATGVATKSESNPSSDNFDAGSYADPTRAIPGSLVVNDNGNAPSVESYNEKTG